MDFTYFWVLAVALMLIHQHEGAEVQLLLTLWLVRRKDVPARCRPHGQNSSTFSVKSPTAEEGPVAQLPHTAHRREKRCSCENQKDKECIFFCHIGIVWVNTPSHVVPYGFGSVRLKRDLDRCLCRDAQDAECLSFCSVQRQTEVENAVLKRKTGKQLKTHQVAFWEKRSRHALEHQT